MALPPAAIDSWNCTSALVGVPPRARPSFVADLINRLRRVNGPSLSGLKGETVGGACSIIGDLSGLRHERRRSWHRLYAMDIEEEECSRSGKQQREAQEHRVVGAREVEQPAGGDGHQEAEWHGAQGIKTHDPCKGACAE